MVKKLLYLLLTMVILTTIYITTFELILYSFHAPFFSTIKEPTIHNATWTYLLKQQYISFIELDAFNIHEKRHLLDVKRVFEQTYTLWLALSSISLFIIFIVKVKYQFKTLLTYLSRIGLFINILFTIISLNFLNRFIYFHTLFFPQGTWSFPKESLLIKWFPLLYFQEFFILFLILTSSLFLCGLLFTRNNKATPIER